MTYLFLLLVLAAVAVFAVSASKRKPAESAPAAEPASPAPAPAPVAPTVSVAPVSSGNPLVDMLRAEAEAQATLASSAPAAAPAGSEFSPAPVMTYAACTGQNLPATGTTSYRVTEGPARVRVSVLQWPGSFAGPYVLTVNGVSKAISDPDTSNPIDTSGPTVDILVETAGNSHLCVRVGEGL